MKSELEQLRDERDALKEYEGRAFAQEAELKRCAMEMVDLQAERDGFWADWNTALGGLKVLRERAETMERAACDGAALRNAAESRADAALEQVAALREALEHMAWCQSCAEGSWDDCEDGRQATAALADTVKAAETFTAAVRREARAEALEEAAEYMEDVFDQPMMAGELRSLLKRKPGGDK